MFKNLPTGTKLFILCATFLISIAVPIYGLVTEKRIAVEFSRKELLGSGYLSTVREIYSAVLAPGRQRAGETRDLILTSSGRSRGPRSSWARICKRPTSPGP